MYITLYTPLFFIIRMLRVLENILNQFLFYAMFVLNFYSKLFLCELSYAFILYKLFYLINLIITFIKTLKQFSIIYNK